MTSELTSAATSPEAKSSSLKGAKGGHILATDHEDRKIFDIRREATELSILEEIKGGLRAAKRGAKTLPTLLLYDDLGLKLFEKITYLDEYYLTNAEIELLETYSTEIAESLRGITSIIELGSGNLRKTDILLRAVDKLGIKVSYFALDLDRSELERTLSLIPADAYAHVKCFGLHGTYDDGLAWLSRPDARPRAVSVWSLGSSIGNFTRPGAADFLHGFIKTLKPTDNFFIGIDTCKDPAKVYRAYNDTEDVTHQFTLNGLRHANNIIGKQEFDLDVWRARGRFNVEKGCHQAFVYPTSDVSVLGATVRANEEVRIEESHKYGASETAVLFEEIGAYAARRWTKAGNDHAMHLIAKKKFAFPWEPEEYASRPVPTWQEWTHLWSLWDAVTRDMIPDDALLTKPIKLRNACIFYLGHIPAFFDLKLTESTGQPLTEPANYREIFERGIDPDVDNPEKCHDHSAIPDSWPPLAEILDYQARVRDRVKALYDSGAVNETKVARGVWLGYEHECMHLETLLYMLIQSDKAKPPPFSGVPVFAEMAKEATANAVPNEWFTVPASDLVIGIDDNEADFTSTRYFGWDVEKPPRKVSVPSFVAKGRPISIGEYAHYLHQTGQTKIPASWDGTVGALANGNGHTNGAHTQNGDSVSNGDSNLALFVSRLTVRTVFGYVPLSQALEWPVSASYDELAACAEWMGGRIPTLEEARSIYNHAENNARSLKAAELSDVVLNTIPAVNGHLSNEGVEVTPPQLSSQNGASAAADTKEGPLNPRDLFVSLKGCNVGFQNWVPQAVTHKGNQLCGQGDMGGLWEWTSTPLRPHEGYEPMPLYPAYSRDFFDEKHNVVLGGSWATPPRLAGRKSFINWYQHNYPYVWAGARLVKDA